MKGLLDAAIKVRKAEMPKPDPIEEKAWLDRINAQN